MTPVELEELRTLLHAGIDRLAEANIAAGRFPSKEDIQHARIYRMEAGKLRRRVAKRLALPNGEGEDPAELERRAAYFEQRAGHLERAEPMPRHLRTEAETLKAIDEFRRRLQAIVEESLAFIHPQDLLAFRLAVEKRGGILPANGSDYAQHVFGYLFAGLQLLGVELGENGAKFAPFASPSDGAQVFTIREDEPPSPVSP